MNAANRENDGENDCQDIVAKCDAQIKNRKTEKQKNRTSREIRQTAQVQAASVLVRLYSWRFHCDRAVLALVYGRKARTLHKLCDLVVLDGTEPKLSLTQVRTKSLADMRRYEKSRWEGADKKRSVHFRGAA
jgi:hypothetical protein